MTGLIRWFSNLGGGPGPRARGAPWRVDVDVYLNDMNANPPGFQICSCLQPALNGPLIFHNNRRDGFEIHFQLHDVNGSGYRFPQNADEAVWSNVGNQCPPPPANAVFEPLRVQHNRTVLVVRNPNPRPAQGPFQYALRLRNAAGQEKVLDPGGDNQNGPPS